MFSNSAWIEKGLKSGKGNTYFCAPYLHLLYLHRNEDKDNLLFTDTSPTNNLLNSIKLIISLRIFLFRILTFLLWFAELEASGTGNLALSTGVISLTDISLLFVYHDLKPIAFPE